MIPYEGICFRERWRELSPRPRWHQQSPDIEQQPGWRRDAARAFGQARFAIGTSYRSDDRANVSIEERPDGVFPLDGRGGTKGKLDPPRLAGIPSAHETISVHPPELPRTVEEVDVSATPGALGKAFGDYGLTVPAQTDYNAGMARKQTLQYTIRGIPEAVDSALRRRPDS